MPLPRTPYRLHGRSPLWPSQRLRSGSRRRFGRHMVDSMPANSQWPSAAQASLPLDVGGLADVGGLLSLFEMCDQGIEAQPLDLRTKILAIALDVADAIDAHVVHLPTLGCLVHRIVHCDALSTVARDLRAHGRMVGARINGGRVHLQPIGREVNQPAAVVCE